MSKITPETAIIVIDMQNDFCSERGSLARNRVDVSDNVALAERLPSFVADAREKGALIVWVRNVSSEAYLSKARLARTGAIGWSPLSVALEGSWGAELHENMQVNETDVEIIKRKYSAFVGTSLDMVLRARGISNVVVCGTATNVCVDSTIRSAYMQDYKVFLPTDMVASSNEELAEAAIKNLGIYFCEITDSKKMLSEM